jgi:hypothetical protein
MVCSTIERMKAYSSANRFSYRTGQKRRLAVGVLMALSTRWVATPAAAQYLDNYLPTNLSGYDVMPGVTVTSRLQPDYDPLGLRFRDVVVSPTISQSLGYDTNVLGTSGARSSSVVNTQGSVHAFTDTPGNSLVMDLDVNHFGYPNLTGQNYTNWSVGGGWSHDLDHDTIAIGLNHFRLNQLPVGIDSVGLLQPLPYQTNVARLSYRAPRGWWTFVPILDFTATRFDDPGGQPGNIGLPTGMDRNVETGSLTTFYQIATQRSAVAVVRVTTAQYTTGQPRPDYEDVSALAGLDYDATGLLRFRALVGYEVRSYHSGQFSNHSSPIVEGTAIWTPTGLTTVTATVLRRIEDANELVQTGYTFSQARLVVDHEYLRNVLLQGRVWVEHAAYLGSSNQQTIYGAGASVTHLLTRNLRLVATYDNSSSRMSGDMANNYARNVVLISLRLAI